MSKTKKSKTIKKALLSDPRPKQAHCEDCYSDIMYLNGKLVALRLRIEEQEHLINNFHELIRDRRGY